VIFLSLYTIHRLKKERKFNAIAKLDSACNQKALNRNSSLKANLPSEISYMLFAKMSFLNDF